MAAHSCARAGSREMAGSAIQSVQSCSDISDSGAASRATARTFSATSGGGMTNSSSGMFAGVDPGAGARVGLLAPRLPAVPQPVASNTNANTTAKAVLRERRLDASAPEIEAN